MLVTSMLYLFVVRLALSYAPLSPGLRPNGCKLAFLWLKLRPFLGSGNVFPALTISRIRERYKEPSSS